MSKYDNYLVDYQVTINELSIQTTYAHHRKRYELAYRLERISAKFPHGHWMLVQYLDDYAHLLETCPMTNNAIESYQNRSKRDWLTAPLSERRVALRIAKTLAFLHEVFNPHFIIPIHD